MLELSGTNFERGVFELRLEEARKGFLGWVAGLGPVKGRLVSLGMFLSAAFLLYYHVPARLLTQARVADFGPEALRYQNFVVWGIVALGVAFYLLVLGLRKESVTVVVDRPKAQLRYRYRPRLALKPSREALVPFAAVESLKVFSPQKEPQTPNGYMEIHAPTLTDPRLRVCRFQFLSNDQFNIYPSNLSKMIGVQPQGDWKDPDDEPLQNA